jgi:hypothetical protein
VARLVGPDVLALLDCGCRVEVRDDGLHVFPCGPEHEQAHIEACQKVAAETGIECGVEP